MRAEVRVQLDDRVNCELCTLTCGMFIIRTTCMLLSLSASCTFHAILFFFTHSSFYSCLQFHYYISPSFDIYFMCPDIIFSSSRPLPLLWLCCVVSRRRLSEYVRMDQLTVFGLGRMLKSFQARLFSVLWPPLSTLWLV